MCEVAGGGPSGRSRNPITILFVGLVRGYQLIVSPWFAPTCRYHPSCSAYAIEAFGRHGSLKGLGLATWRILRCNPWSKGGVDQVPACGRWRQMPWQPEPIRTVAAKALPSLTDLPQQIPQPRP